MKKNLPARMSVALGSLLTAIIFTPQVTHAVRNLKELINLAITYFNYAIYLIIGLATVIFVWNVYQLYFKPDADRTEAGKYVLYSVVGFFVMLSFWGLVNLISNSLNLDTTDPRQPFGGSQTTQQQNIYVPYSPYAPNNNPLSPGYNPLLPVQGSSGPVQSTGNGGSSGAVQSTGNGGSSGAVQSTGSGGSSGAVQSTGNGGSSGAVQGTNNNTGVGNRPGIDTGI